MNSGIIKEKVIYCYYGRFPISCCSINFCYEKGEKPFDILNIQMLSNLFTFLQYKFSLLSNENLNSMNLRFEFEISISATLSVGIGQQLDYIWSVLTKTY